MEFLSATADPLGGDQPLLAGLAAASVRGRGGDGAPLRRQGDRVDPGEGPALRRCATFEGFSLHADVAVPARDRARLERLCRYVARPPLATERLERLVDGRLLYRLRHRWRDGTTHVAFTGREMLQRLVPLIPPPRAHQARYHGVLAPCAAERATLVRDPLPPRKGRPPREASLAAGSCPAANAAPRPDPRTGRGPWDPPPDVRGLPPPPGAAAPAVAATSASSPLPDGRAARRRYAWAELLRRVFAIDALACPRCGGTMRLLAAVHPAEAVQAILDCLGLPSRAPPPAPARPSRPDPESAYR